MSTKLAQQLAIIGNIAREYLIADRQMAKEWPSPSKETVDRWNEIGRNLRQAYESISR